MTVITPPRKLPTDRSSDVAVIGAGILGLATAWSAARMGLSVRIFERSAAQVGASVRNFGMIWPIGQPRGVLLDRALRSRAAWLAASASAGFWHEPLGSLHIARHEDELAVLEEFVSAARRDVSSGYSVEMLTAAQACARSPGLVREGLLGAMFSSTEVCIDPREAVAALTRHLESALGVAVQRSTPVKAVEHPEVFTADGRTFRADRIVVCSGEDTRTLFPEVYRESGLVHCKLQMMRTAPQPGGWRLGPMLAAGATLRHYRAFEQCPSLSRVRERFSREYPRFDRFGIHVMASQTGPTATPGNAGGAVTLGDSHEYGEPVAPFDHDEIDTVVLDYLAEFLRLPEPRIAERWHGVYIKFAGAAAARTELIAAPQPGVRVVSGVGGAGMTLSFGLADEVFEHWDRAERSELP